MRLAAGKLAGLRSSSPRGSDVVRALILLILFTLPFQLLAENWPPAYSEVRAYYYDGGASGQPVIKDGRLHPTIQDKEGVLLTDKQVSRLLAGARDTERNPRALIKLSAATRLCILRFGEAGSSGF